LRRKRERPAGRSFFLGWVILSGMLRAGLLAASILSLSVPALAGPPDKPVWPLTLRDGIPATLPGWDAAPRDPLPDTDENEMGVYTEVSRFYQKIEPSAARQFRIVVQDYGKGKDLEGAIRKAVAEAGKSPGVDTDRGTAGLRRHRPFAGLADDAGDGRGLPRPSRARPGLQPGPRAGREAPRARRLRPRRVGQLRRARRPPLRSRSAARAEKTGHGCWSSTASSHASRDFAPPTRKRRSGSSPGSSRRRGSRLSSPKSKRRSRVSLSSMKV
jgi:hypothetical protein